MQMKRLVNKNPRIPWLAVSYILLIFFFFLSLCLLLGFLDLYSMESMMSGGEDLSCDDRFWGLDASRCICHSSDPLDSFMYGSSGCLGCYAYSTPVIAVDEPSKGLKIRGRTVKRPRMPEDFWSTSTYEMENSVQSQRSISSISTSNPTNFDSHSGAGSSSNPPEFINQGLHLWNQTRQQWIGRRRMENQTQLAQKPRFSWNASYESILGTSKPFPQPIPLSEMVDFLVDSWEQDGMYD